ncbi:MAG: hypothetical protein ACK559_26070, partial [bacterium]
DELHDRLAPVDLPRLDPLAAQEVAHRLRPHLRALRLALLGGLLLRTLVAGRARALTRPGSVSRGLEPTARASLRRPTHRVRPLAARTWAACNWSA